MNRLSAWLFLTVLLFAAGCATLPEDSGPQVAVAIHQSSQLTSGNQKWNGPGDASLRGHLYRTAEGLHFTARVVDDVFWADSETSWENDGVEVYFDFRPLRHRVYRDVYERGVMQLVIIPGFSSTLPNHVFHNRGSGKTSLPGLKVSTRILSGNEYEVNLFLPYDSLAQQEFLPRRTFRFDVGLNDADGGPVESRLMWAGDGMNWDTPANFRDVTLP